LGCDYLEPIRGIGPKSAFKLLKDYGSLKKVVKHLEEKYALSFLLSFLPSRLLPLPTHDLHTGPLSFSPSSLFPEQGTDTNASALSHIDKQNAPLPPHLHPIQNRNQNRYQSRKTTKTETSLYPLPTYPPATEPETILPMTTTTTKSERIRG
jgi:hypothetical protein